MCEYFTSIASEPEPGQMALQDLVGSFYHGEPCGICGELIGDERHPIFLGYSDEDKSRAAHEVCFDKLSDAERTELSQTRRHAGSE